MYLNFQDIKKEDGGAFVCKTGALESAVQVDVRGREIGFIVEYPHFVNSINAMMFIEQQQQD